VLHLIEII